MLANIYFDVGRHHEQQPWIASEIFSVDDSFARKLFPVRSLPYILVIFILVLSLFSLKEERTTALTNSPWTFAVAKVAEPVARLSLPARAALYRDDFIAH